MKFNYIVRDRGIECIIDMNKWNDNNDTVRSFLYERGEYFREYLKDKRYMRDIEKN